MKVDRHLNCDIFITQDGICFSFYILPVFVNTVKEKPTTSGKPRLYQCESVRACGVFVLLMLTWSGWGGVIYFVSYAPWLTCLNFTSCMPRNVLLPFECTSVGLGWVHGGIPPGSKTSQPLFRVLNSCAAAAPSLASATIKRCFFWEPFWVENLLDTKL